MTPLEARLKGRGEEVTKRTAPIRFVVLVWHLRVGI